MESFTHTHIMDLWNYENCKSYDRKNQPFGWKNLSWTGFRAGSTAASSTTTSEEGIKFILYPTRPYRPALNQAAGVTAGVKSILLPLVASVPHPRGDKATKSKTEVENAGENTEKPRRLESADRGISIYLNNINVQNYVRKSRTNFAKALRKHWKALGRVETHWHAW